MKYAINVPGDVELKFKVLKQLIELNKKFQNLDVVDKLFQVIYKVAKGFENELETLLWDNFDCLKRSVVILPKLSMH